MNALDLTAIAAYVVLVSAAGLWFRKKAARDLEAYFLGGKRLRWQLLSASAAVSTFDITGTMWMVSVLYVLGMQSWWHHWMWGVALPAFAIGFMARWVRRSNVMTAAEWMATRFGSDAGGRMARLAAALMAILFTVGMIGYAFQGIGKFAAVYLPLEPLAEYLPVSAQWLAQNQAHILAAVIFAVTTLYVVVGGFYSVVITDVIQTAILTVAALAIAVIAYMNVTPEALADKVPEGFTSILPAWRLDGEGPRLDEFRFFGFLVIAWVAKGLLMNMGGPGQLYDFQRYLATSSVREACKMSAAWPLFLISRWAMVMGITLLAITGTLDETDPERIMPAILQQYLYPGLRGLVIAGLLAAFMSTFSSTINAGAAFVVRDLWQPLAARRAGTPHLIRASYAATVLLVLVGMVVGCQAGSIAAIWQWLMMALTAAVIVPNVLRWYWWRLNGWGYAAGTMGGILCSLAVLYPTKLPEFLLVGGAIPDYVTFPLVCLGSLVPCLAVSWLTRPTAATVLASFYENIRPFGWWGPVAACCPAAVRARRPPGEAPARSIFNTVLAVSVLTALYLGSMYIVGRWHVEAALCGACVLAGCTVLYFTWYRYLPDD